jgi:hypothetical protein
VRPIGVYFSPKSRNYFPTEFIDAYRGTMMLLMQSHLEFQVVTPRTLDAFGGDVLILPDVRCLGKGEVDVLRSRFSAGKTLIVSGETGKYDETGAEQAANPIHGLLGIADPARKVVGRSRRRFVYYPRSPGADYYAQLGKEFNDRAASRQVGDAAFERMRAELVAEILRVSGLQPAVDVEASPFVSTQIAEVDGKTTVFLANFKGLKAGETAHQMPERNVRITFHAPRKGVVYVLPFLGHVTKLAGEWKNGALACVLPELDKGAVIWIE